MYKEKAMNKCEVCNTEYTDKELNSLTFGKFKITICKDCGFVADELLASWLKEGFKIIESKLEAWKEFLKKEQD